MAACMTRGRHMTLSFYLGLISRFCVNLTKRQSERLKEVFVCFIVLSCGHSRISLSKYYLNTSYKTYFTEHTQLTNVYEMQKRLYI